MQTQANPLDMLNKLMLEMFDVDEAESAIVEIVNDIIDHNIPEHVALSPYFTVGDLQKMPHFWTNFEVMDCIAGAFIGRATAMLLSHCGINPRELPVEAILAISRNTDELQKDLAERAMATAIDAHGGSVGDHIAKNQMVFDSSYSKAMH